MVKGVLLLLFLVVLGVLFSYSSSSSSNRVVPTPTLMSTQNWKTYTDKLSSYSINYPLNFEVNINPQTDQANEVNFSPKGETYQSNEDFSIYDSNDPVSWIRSWQLPTGSCGTTSSDLCTYNKFTNKKGVVFDHYLVDGKGQFDEYGYNSGDVHLDIGFSHYMDKQERDAIINSFTIK